MTDALSRRRTRIAGRFEDMEHRYQAIRARGLPRQYLLDVEYEIAHLRTELDWLDGTLRELATGELDWHTPLPAHLSPGARTLEQDTPTPTEAPR
ncbi:hypothetical protein [Cellulomonas soli]